MTGEVKRDEHGHWLPGVSGYEPSARRRNRAAELVGAITDEMPAVEIAGLLRQAMTWAVEYKSTRAAILVADYWRDTVVGKPRQRIDVATGNSELAEALLHLLATPQPAQIASLNDSFIQLSDSTQPAASPGTPRVPLLADGDTTWAGG